MSKYGSKTYQFNIVNGAVAAVFEVKNGRIKSERMERDETWTVQGSNVIETEMEHGRLKTTTYSDADGDGLFIKVAPTVMATDGNLPTKTSGRDREHHSLADCHDDLGFENSNVYGDTAHHMDAKIDMALMGVQTLVSTDFVF